MRVVTVHQQEVHIVCNSITGFCSIKSSIKSNKRYLSGYVSAILTDICSFTLIFGLFISKFLTCELYEISVKVFTRILFTAVALQCTPKCSENAICRNITGTNECECNIGYDGDGITCSGTNQTSYTVKLFLTNQFAFVSTLACNYIVR